MRLDLNWSTHIRAADKKFNKILNVACQSVTASQKTHLINALASTVIEYGICVVEYNKTTLTQLDTMMKKLVKNALQMPRDTQSNLLWTSTMDEGMGLTCLQDRQQIIFSSSIIDQILKGPDSLGKQVIRSKLDLARH